MYLLWLLGFLWEGTFAEKRETDRFFMHRDWEEGRMTDAQYCREGGYTARRFVAEKHAREKQLPRVPRAPAAFGFRSRPFS